MTPSRSITKSAGRPVWPPSPATVDDGCRANTPRTNAGRAELVDSPRHGPQGEVADRTPREPAELKVNHALPVGNRDAAAVERGCDERRRHHATRERFGGGHATAARFLVTAAVPAAVTKN